MSLIHDALARAREESARREALARGETPPASPPPAHYRFRSPFWIVAVLALGILVGGVALGRWLAAVRPAGGHEPIAAGPRDRGDSWAAPQAAGTEPERGDDRPTAEATGPATPEVEETGDGSAGGATGAGTRPEAGTEDRGGAPSSPHAAAPSAGAATALSPGAPTGETRPADAGIRTPVDREEGTAVRPGSSASPSVSAGRGPSAASPAPAQGRAGTHAGASFDLGGGRALELQGVVWNTTSPSAVVNGTLIEPGERIEGFELLRIEPRAAVLFDGEREIVLSLGPAGG